MGDSTFMVASRFQRCRLSAEIAPCGGETKGLSPAPLFLAAVYRLGCAKRCTNSQLVGVSLGRRVGARRKSDQVRREIFAVACRQRGAARTGSTHQKARSISVLVSGGSNVPLPSSHRSHASVTSQRSQVPYYMLHMRLPRRLVVTINSRHSAGGS